MMHSVLCYSITQKTTGNARGRVQVNPWTGVQYLQFIIVACAAFMANFAGGVFARRVADRMHLAVGFSAGTVIAVAFFIFMPQAVLSRPPAHGANELLPLVGLGFVIALLLDRFGSFWMADSEERLTTRKHYGHAVLNGAAIGLTYHVSPAVSAVVTAALLAHEFSDSADAARQGLRERQDRRGLREYLISSLCVTAGLAPTYFHAMTPGTLGVALALFGGYFIYLSASDLIPESHHLHPQLLTVALTFGGAGAMYLASLMVK
jgi:ZIP family zinc transporter